MFFSSNLFVVEKKRIAKDFDLEIVEISPFHEFYQHMTEIQSYEELMLRMKVVSKASPNFPAEEWEATGLYLAFVFQKSGAKEPIPETSHKYNFTEAQLFDFSQN